MSVLGNQKTQTVENWTSSIPIVMNSTESVTRYSSEGPSLAEVPFLLYAILENENKYLRKGWQQRTNSKLCY